jgi:hypothetical protein
LLLFFNKKITTPKSKAFKQITFSKFIIRKVMVIWQKGQGIFTKKVLRLGKFSAKSTHD